MSNTTDFPSLQYSDFNCDKFLAQEDQFFDKENCNVHQPQISQRLPFQPKNMNTNALSERIEELSYQSTMDASVDFDQISRFSEDFTLPPNFLDVSLLRDCQHANKATRRCTYCKDCGIFLPRNGSMAYRDTTYSEKLTLCSDEIYEVMLQGETKNRSYVAGSPHVQFRRTVTDWIFQVSQDLKVSPDTTCTIISYIDTILSKVEIPKEKLQLIILSCLILATKFSETDDRVPPLREAYNLCQGIYSIEEFKRAENFILETLDWSLKTITPHQYIHHYISKGCIFSSDNTGFLNIDSDAFKRLRRYAESFVNLSIDDYEFNQYPSHIVGCASIANSRKLLGITPLWTPELEELTGASWEAIETCYNKLYSAFEVTFPELVSASKAPSVQVPEDLQKEKENQIIQNYENNAEAETKVTPLKKIHSKVITKVAVSGKKKGVPAVKKTIKQKTVSRLSKKADTGNKQKQTKVIMNLEASSEFFEKDERSSSIKRNLIY